MLVLATDDARGGLGVGEIEIADDDFVGVDNKVMYESVTGETIRNAFAVMIE